MLKMLWCWFQQCFGTFSMLLVEGSSEMGRFRIYLTTFSECEISEIQNQRRLCFFSKYLKSYCCFQKCCKKVSKGFYFWDNWMRIGIIKLSLLTTVYFSSAANVLRSWTKIWHVNKRQVLQLNWLGSDQ